MSWHKGRIGFLDIESTSPDPEVARIVTVCMGVIEPDGSHGGVERLVNPGVEIPAEATQIHGVTNEHAITNGGEPAGVVLELVDWISGWWEAGLPIVAYNAPYDLTVIDREMRRHLGESFRVSGPVIDPFVIDRRLDQYRRGKRTLSVTCRHYGVPLEDAHNAFADALAAARLALALAERFPRLASTDLRDLYRYQARWHAERQRDFRAYRERIGDPLDDISEDWPQRPFAKEGAAA